MDKTDLSHHISKRFDEELESLRSRVLAMGGLVEQQLADAIAALIGGDDLLAKEAIISDYKVNSMDVSIDEYCTLILARRQPAASDLRLVLAVIKTVADLERIGDEAKRVARMGRQLVGTDHSRKSFSEIEHLGELVGRMLNRALDAFARMDAEAALATAREDSKVDREYEGILRQAMTYMMEDPRSIPHVLDIIWSVRALERIGDRCCNICEYIIYFVKGKDVRHVSLDQIEQELHGGDSSASES